ncbi:hypothetical protein ACFLUP_02095 [Chloroflexota bacterium]
MIRSLVLSLAIFVLSFPGPVYAAEPANGMIDGQIINETAEGSSVAEQDISLKTFLDGIEEDNNTTTSNAEGKFVFEGLSSEPGYSYELSLTFQEVEYFSELITFEEGDSVKPIELSVYDSTTNEATIKVLMAYSIIRVEPDILHVTEHYMFVNETDRTYIGSTRVDDEGGRETLKLFLPPEANEIALEYGLIQGHVVISEDALIDTMAVLPGGKEVLYSYDVNFDSGAYKLTRGVNYPISAYALLVEGENAKVISDRLSAEEPVEVDGTLFSYYSSKELLPGNTLEAQLSNLLGNNNQGAIIWILAGVIVLGIGFSFAFLTKKRNLQIVSREDNPEEVKQRFLIQLAQLDDDFESGKIAEEDYKRLRAEGKIYLVELMQSSNYDKDGE